jgi:peroxiredoxin
MRRLGLYISLILLILTGCGKNKHGFTLKGNIKDAPQVKVILAKLTKERMIVVDSVKTDKKGNFKISGEINNSGFYILRTDKSRYINLILHPGDRIDLTTNLENFDTEYYVEGSRDSHLVQELIKKQDKTLEQITALSNQYEESKSHPETYPENKKRIDSAYNNLVAQYKDYSADFIHKNPQSLASLMALYQQLGIHTSLFNPVEDITIFNFVDSNLTVRYPDVEAVKNLNKEVVDVKERLKYKNIEKNKLALGTSAPEIALPDTGGNIIQLSSLKGKYVLLNFWASWSGPCQKENNLLKQIYNKYNKRGFTIYQVSLDQDRNSWVKAIKLENLPWINVSDLKYWNSVVVPLYNIYNLPENFLLDKTGKIIASDIRGNEIDNQVKELFYNK